MQVLRSIIEPNDKSVTIGRSVGGAAYLFKCSQNAVSFIDRLRDELLNETLFRSLPHARHPCHGESRRLSSAESVF
jgi:hypothetical protein